MNRTLPDAEVSGSNHWKSNALQGALAAAIDNAGIIKRFQDEMIMAVSHRNFDKELKTAAKKTGGSTSASGPAASHAPGFLTQADLLSRLGPCLSARSDTFRVRFYGETTGTSTTNEGTDESHLRGEAIFQRLPDVAEQKEVFSSAANSSDGDDWNGLYRTFALIGFRWLRDNEI